MKEEKKFISLLNDTTFKALWKKEVTRKFLWKVIYKITGLDVKDYTLIDNELNTGNNHKDYRLDILLKKENNIVNIEMNQFISEYTPTKNHTYLNRLAGNAYLEGETYQKFYVTQINFNNSFCKENKDIGISIYEFVDLENNLKIEGLKCYEIYLEKYKNICYNDANEVGKYLGFFKAENYEEMLELAQGNKEMLELVDELERLSRDEYFGGLYDASVIQKKCENSARSDGFNEGHKEGIQEGRTQEKNEIAIAMLRENEDMSNILKYTGLSIEEINQLKKEI